MISFAVLSNPRSEQNKRGLDSLRAVIRDHPNTRHVELTEIEKLGSALADLASEGVQVLILNGGDGTVQAALTEICENGAFESPPLLAILPRGMTNMTAEDVGLRGKAPQALRRLLSCASLEELQRHAVRRHILRLENAAGFPPQCGMFFGAVGIVQAINICRDRVHTLGLQAGWATGVTLAGMLIGWMFRRKNRPVIAPETLSVSLDSGPLKEVPTLLLLTTTLDRLILGSRPFWNQNEKPLRYTRIAHPSRGLVRWAPRILFGGKTRKLPEEVYESHGARRIELQLSSPFTLDGQIYEPIAGKPVVLTAEHEVSFIRW